MQTSYFLNVFTLSKAWAIKISNMVEKFILIQDLVFYFYSKKKRKRKVITEPFLATYMLNPSIPLIRIFI